MICKNSNSYDETNAAHTGWHTGVGRLKKNYSVDIQLEMDLFVQK